MTKKSSASSQPGKLVRVKAEDILSKPLTREQRSELARLKNRPDSEIDYVLTWLRSFGHGYTSRINMILRTVMEQQQARK